jgi:hypothetical protein
MLSKEDISLIFVYIGGFGLSDMLVELTGIGSKYKFIYYAALLFLGLKIRKRSKNKKNHARKIKKREKIRNKERKLKEKIDLLINKKDNDNDGLITITGNDLRHSKHDEFGLRELE